ncbi:MAG: hypothetical protein KDD69_12945 [Bdellovibrionales bacterium]|nr:hypothetical protein [Bdellovibrionales bacterium]
MVAADLHVHLYPCYDLPRLLDYAWQNLRRIAPNADSTTHLLGLTERWDCHFFRALSQKTLTVPGWTIDEGRERGVLRLSSLDGKQLWLFAGRQIITAERLELLALTADVTVPDGLPFADAHAAVLDQGALAVLNWAPGKWMFARRPIVEQLLKRVEPEALLICDTTLRPLGWGEPELMRFARTRGYAVIAGSDPLPFGGEESRAGTYGVCLEQGFVEDQPVTSLQTLLRAGRWSYIGARSNPLSAAVRIGRNELARRRRGSVGDINDT